MAGEGAALGESDGPFAMGCGDGAGTGTPAAAFT